MSAEMFVLRLLEAAVRCSALAGPEPLHMYEYAIFDLNDAIMNCARREIQARWPNTIAVLRGAA